MNVVRVPGRLHRTLGGLTKRRTNSGPGIACLSRYAKKVPQRHAFHQQSQQYTDSSNHEHGAMRSWSERLKVKGEGHGRSSRDSPASIRSPNENSAEINTEEDHVVDDEGTSAPSNNKHDQDSVVHIDEHDATGGLLTDSSNDSLPDSPVVKFTNKSPVPGHVYVHTFDVHQGGHVAVVEIGNPQKANSLSSDTLRSLSNTFTSLAGRHDLRAVILTGCKFLDRAIFSAGADIKEMEALSTSEEAQAFITTIYNACESVRKCPVPTIARIDGACFGAALEIAACCDFRYATNQSHFSMKEVALGIPSVVQARMLANIIGWQETKRMVLLGTDYTAKSMRRIGLLDHRYETALYLDHQIDGLINTIANNGPKATRAQKKLNIFWEENPLKNGIVRGIDTFAQMWNDGGSEPKKYMGAWLERSRQQGSAEVADDDPDDTVAQPSASELAKPSAWNFLKLRDYTR